MNAEDTFRRRWKQYLLACLVLANIAVWAAYTERRGGESLRVHFLDVGQGDSILIESPQHGRMLIDGGPTRLVLSELGKILPFGDRKIDVLLATHPDADHIGGLPEVVSRYEVGVFIEPGVESDTGLDDELRARLRSRGVETLLARRGMVVDFGDGAKLTVLFPGGEVKGLDTNDASIVARLTYGGKSFLLTGDAGLQTEMRLLSTDRESLDVDVLKVGHHGSRTSTSISFLQTTTPDYAVISAGRDNSYGHPHKEVQDNLLSVGAAVLSTAEEGTVVFETDGNDLKIK